MEGPYAGDAYEVGADPQGNVYVETQYGYVYRSSDSGKTWVHADYGLALQSAAYLLIDPSGNLYTGNFFSGLFKSTNRGENWLKTSLDGAAPSAALLKDGRICVGGIAGVSISTDDGDTWISHQITSDRVNVLSLAEDSLGNLYAGLQMINPTPRPPYGGGVYISRDGGDSWTLLGLPLVSITSIAVGGQSRVFACAGYGIYTTSPADTGWAQNNNGIPRSKIWSLTSSGKGEVVAATDNGVYVYDDNAAYWNAVGTGLSSIPVQSVGFCRDGTMFAGTSHNGIFRFDTSSGYWVQLGFKRVPVLSVGVDPEGELFAGTEDVIYRTRKGDGSWISASGWYSGGRVNQLLLPDSSSKIYAASPGGLFYSTNAGDRWILSLESNVNSVGMSPSGILYVATTSGVLGSATGGLSWTRLDCIALPASPICGIAADTSGDLFAGTLNNGVFRSTDGGQFWNQTGLSSQLMFHTVEALGIDPAGGIFAGTDSSGGYYSADKGQDWEKMMSLNASGISQYLLTASYYYAATSDNGVFFSGDRGHNWASMNEGLTNLCVHSLASDGRGYLYAATDSGIFKVPAVPTGVERSKPLAGAFRLSQNYPNPFNPTTVIGFVVSACTPECVSARRQGSGFVVLKVYDVLGRPVKTLVNSRQAPGEHSVVFDAKGLPSGVYFYRLQTAGYSETRKMVLIR